MELNVLSGIKCAPRYIYLIVIIICFTCFLVSQSTNDQKWSKIFLNVEQCENMRCTIKDLTKIGTLIYGFMGGLTISFYFYHKTISPNIKRLKYECENILSAASNSTLSAKTVICILGEQVIIDYTTLSKEFDNIKNNIDDVTDIFANSREIFTVEHRKAIYNILFLMKEFNDNAKLCNLNGCKITNDKLHICVSTLKDDISIKGMKKIIEVLK